MHRTFAAAQFGQAVGHRVAGHRGGLLGGVGQGQPDGQAGGQRGGVGAPGAVGRGDPATGDGMASAGAVEEVVDRLAPCPPVTRAARAPIATRASASLARSSVAISVSAWASGRLGVTTVASGNSLVIRVPTASGSSRRLPELATMTGSTTSGRSRGASASATASSAA